MNKEEITMAISAKLVKELRDKTGAGMMDCKKALTETSGDIDKAIDWLREKGISKAAKKADRIAAEGLCDVVVNGNEALLFELNSETDFVAKNAQFLELLEKLGAALLHSNATTLEEALEVEVDGVSVEQFTVNATAKIGEKIRLRRIYRFVKEENEKFRA